MEWLRLRGESGVDGDQRSSQQDPVSVQRIHASGRKTVGRDVQFSPAIMNGEMGRQQLPVGSRASAEATAAPAEWKFIRPTAVRRG